ncbi:DNA adenine methylase [Erythrobacter sp.]|uniref:DNA adenine methylase n=1 Tax=Erythrobacter sp. TaxID=1042 RepID=UPI001B1F712F|nr:DNA adenine methylase [Erythrobacter sp.]MBO6526000.1 DNA adenine methylase [Erythrobacter sp.]MBO6530651.1 DNA adenine methylase [Erythrobacter sp.]
MRRTGRYSPLRYPGGKGKLAGYLKAIISENSLNDGTYVEPFAGGAGIACELLLENYVREIHINDLSPSIHCFWNSSLGETERFCDDINAAKLTVEEWDRQKLIFENERRSSSPDQYALGFATFFLNRTNRSGILNGGIIGGRSQESEWGIDARFNRADLIDRIRLIASMNDRISVTSYDALKLVKQLRKKNCFRTLMYLDPPYYEKGRQLYLDYYREDDHRKLAKAVQKDDQPFNWIVSYDNVQAIKSLYGNSRSFEYNIHYSARSASVGSEIIFFDRKLRIPTPEDHLKVTKRVAA